MPVTKNLCILCLNFKSSKQTQTYAHFVLHDTPNDVHAILLQTQVGDDC